MWSRSRPVKEASSPGLFPASLPALKATKAIMRETNPSPLRNILYRTKSVFTYVGKGHPGFPLCEPMGCWKMKTPAQMSQRTMGHCVYVSQLSYPFICQWTSRLLPCPSYCKQCCDEHWGTRVSFNSGFLGVYTQQCDFWVVWQFYLQFFKESPHCSP